MPELPEVEATVRYLRERIEGETIKHIVVNWPRTVSQCSVSEFSRKLEGARIAQLFRRGKFVGMMIGDNQPLSLYTHLRMSGSFDVVDELSPASKHDQVVFVLKNKKSVRFNDPRKFGRMYLVESTHEFDSRVGIDPLTPEFTVDALAALLAMKRGSIKPTLLNQRLIAGLGNIYVDECLWKAGIHPLTPAWSVSKVKIPRLHTAIVETLTEAIELSGTDFGDGVVEGGMYQPMVYGREGEECVKCARVIRRIVVGQRGTRFCPTCQRRR